MLDFRGKKALSNLATALVEALPFVSLLPGITFLVWRHIRISREEDRARSAKEQAEAAMQLGKRTRNARRGPLRTYGAAAPMSTVGYVRAPNTPPTGPRPRTVGYRPTTGTVERPVEKPKEQGGDLHTPTQQPRTLTTKDRSPAGTYPQVRDTQAAQERYTVPTRTPDKTVGENARVAHHTPENKTVKDGKPVKEDT